MEALSFWFTMFLRVRYFCNPLAKYLELRGAVAEHHLHLRVSPSVGIGVYIKRIELGEFVVIVIIF